MRDKQVKNFLIIMGVTAAAVSTAVFFINTVCGALCFMLSALLMTAFIINEKERYAQIQKLNDYLSHVCSGDYSLDITDNEEGEYSLLKNNIYKVVVMLQASNEALKNDKTALADFLADISHQLKTPLTSIMVMTDIIKNEQNGEKRAEFLEVVQNQLERIKWLIATILKISRLDAGTVEFSNTSFALCDMLEECLKPFLITADIKNIKIVTDIQNFDLCADKNWTAEAVQNIIKNCIEHTQSGGEIKIESVASSVYNKLIISDNGAGISKNDLPHIFERFYHGENSSDDSVGIGLALSKDILSKQNAVIDVQSEEGRGTSFTVKFYKSVV